MQIQGLQKLTLLDYPGRTACTVFLPGCNFRCPFCHNAPLLTAADEDGMDEGELLAFLKKRQGLLDGVAVTGGEPLLRPELPALLEKIKALGYAELHDDASFVQLGDWLMGAKRYFIQCFEPRETVLQAGLHAPSEMQLHRWAELVRPKIHAVKIRGI